MHPALAIEAAPDSFSGSDTMEFFRLRLIPFFLAIGLACAIPAPPARAQSTANYFYVVTASDINASESVFSNEVAAAVPLQGTHTVALTCTEAASSAVGFTFYRGRVSGGPYARLNSSLVSACAFTDTFSPPVAPVLKPAIVN